MMPLHTRIAITPARPRILARVTEDAAGLGEELLLVRGEAAGDARKFRAVLRIGAPARGDGEVALPAAFDYLAAGDIVRIDPAAGELRVLYRRASPHNVLFITERCNSRCLMCSQPPRAVDDEWLVDELLETIPLMAPETRELCITGGEPTLLGDRLLEVIRAVQQWLPHTALHMLSNGRLLADCALARKIAAVGHRDFMMGIPLYADVADRHDFVVQAAGAFDETIRGIMNLARLDQKVELRFVMHRQTVERLPETARFIARNLPFAHQVALMGLELMGFARTNLDALWIDPFDYQEPLAAAVEILRSARIPVMIYNHPLCLLPPALWPFAVQSISDWKNISMPACEPCQVRDRCSGFFASATLRSSRHLRPFLETPVA